jgi:protein involved in polysaccharide export with SLBB domain
MGRFLVLFAVSIILSYPAFAEELDLGFSETPPVPDGGYVIGPGDLLQIKVFNVETLSGEYPVRYDGTVMFPYVGKIEAAGVPLGEFNENLAEKLATYYYDPQVVVNIGEFSSCEVYVLGEVMKPGIYMFDGRATVLEVVAQAGGFDRTAARASTMLVRVTGDTPTVTRIDMEKVIDEGVVTLNVPVQRGDIIVVPKTFIANLNQFLNDITPSLATYLRVNSVYRAGWEK